MSHRNRMTKMCRDELIAIIEPPQEIEVVIEKVDVIKLDDGQCDQKLPTLEELKTHYQLGAL